MLCSTTHVYHYLRHADSELVDAIVRDGLRPLSDMPEHPTYARERMRFEQRYQDLAEPLLQRPYDNGGVFFTNVDLRRINGRGFLNSWRFSVPVERLAPDWSVLTYELDGARHRFRLTAHSLRLAAQLWDQELVERWLGADDTGWFRYVPQIVAFQPGGVPIKPSDVQPPG